MARCLLCLAFAACGFQTPSGASTDAQDGSGGPDAPSVSCGSLTCDPHATCLEGPARCECSAGYQGDGVSCADVDECATGNGGCAAACANSTGSFTCYTPQTCDDIAQRVPGFTSGTRTLYFGGDSTKPWQASCEGTAGAWKEYLVLASPNNYAQYTTSGGGTNVRTTYQRIRIVPLTAKIDISDQTHASSSGALNHSGTQVTSMPYGVAMDCEGSGSQTGAAQIDLSGTSFVISDAYQVRGNNANGVVTRQNAGRQLSITGGGNCGWNSPAPAPFNPINTTGGEILDIAYLP